MERRQINTPQAPAAIGPYSQGVRSGRFIYTSGQIPLDPGSGELVGEDITTQTHRVLQNLQAVLSQAGTSLNNVVKTTVFLARMSDFQAMNAVYATYFTSTSTSTGGGVLPARTTVAVAELPRKALVEIECIALVED